jgi:hypothetical protein
VTRSVAAEEIRENDAVPVAGADARATGAHELGHIEQVCRASLHLGGGRVLQSYEHKALPAHAAAAVSARRVQDSFFFVHAQGAVGLGRVRCKAEAAHLNARLRGC